MNDQATPRYAGCKEFRQIRKLLKETGMRTLSDRHRIGQLVESLVPTADRQYGENAIGALTRELGLSENSNVLSQLRAFARTFTMEDVQRLENPVAGSTFTFGWGLALRLMSFPRAQRLQLERECREGEWSTPELNRQIRNRRGRRTKGGPRLKPPESISDGLVQVQVEAERFVKRTNQLWIGGESPVITRQAIARGGAATRRVAAETAVVLRQVAHAVEQLQAALAVAAPTKKRRPVGRKR